MRGKLSVPFTVALCCLALLSGCTMGGRSIEMQSEDVLSTSAQWRQEGAPWLCFYTTDLEPESAPEGEALVGYDHIYKKGWMCWESLDNIYQGAVWFPVKERIGSRPVKSATLTFNNLRTDCTTGQNSCAVRLGLAQAKWSEEHTGLIPAESYSEVTCSPTGQVSVDVTEALRRWTSESDPNSAFVLMGARQAFEDFSNEGMAAEERCLSWYGDFVLTVTF